MKDLYFLLNFSMSQWSTEKCDLWLNWPRRHNHLLKWLVNYYRVTRIYLPNQFSILYVELSMILIRWDFGKCRRSKPVFSNFPRCQEWKSFVRTKNACIRVAWRLIFFKLHTREDSSVNILAVRPSDDKKVNPSKLFQTES